MNIIKKISIAVVFLSLLTGCMTHPDQGFKGEDPQKAIDAHVSAAIEYLKLRDLQAARRHASAALNIDARSAVAHNTMALVYRAEGDDENERKHYRSALRGDGAFSQARNNYGTLLYREGEYKKAIKQFLKAAEDPSYSNRAGAYTNIGKCYLRLEDLVAAEAALQKALRLDVETPIALLELSDMNFRAGEYNYGWRYFQSYASLVAHNARSLWLGIRLAREVDDKDAEASFALLLKNNFNNTAEYQAYLQSLES